MPRAEPHGRWWEVGESIFAYRQIGPAGSKKQMAWARLLENRDLIISTEKGENSERWVSHNPLGFLDLQMLATIINVATLWILYQDILLS